MYPNLVPGMIGIHGCDLSASMDWALRLGFVGIDGDLRALRVLVERGGAAPWRQRLEERGLRLGHVLLPNDWKHDEPRWRALLEELPALAAAAAALGCRRCCTYFGSASDERPYRENLAWHADRLRPVAEILAAHGIAFGMEFMGPPSLRAGRRYAFVHRLEQQLELAALIGTGTVGVLLDTWHLFTSGGSADDLRRLRPGDVVNVHVNDAPPAVEVATCADCDRRLPLETGIIDAPAMLRALAAIGYDGPVTCEPFSAELNDLATRDPAAAGERAAAAMRELWRRAGSAWPEPVPLGTT